MRRAGVLRGSLAGWALSAFVALRQPFLSQAAPVTLPHCGPPPLASATCATAAASISSQSVSASLWIWSIACGDWRHVSVVPTVPAIHLITLPPPAARRFVTCPATALARCSSAGSASQLCTCGSCIERRTPVRRTWFG